MTFHRQLEALAMRQAADTPDARLDALLRKLSAPVSLAPTRTPERFGLRLSGDLRGTERKMNT